MADPVGITGTALGVISLGLQVYGNLKTYIDNYKGRDEHVAKVLRHLENLRSSLDVIRTALPAIEDDFRTESTAVASCLQACEAGLRSLADSIRKYDTIPATDLKGRAKEVKKKMKFPFAVPELDKLAVDIDRVNSHLLVALQGLGLNVQSAAGKSLGAIEQTTRTTAADVTSLLGKVDTITARDVALQGTMTQQVHELSLSRRETLETVSLVRRIDSASSSTESQLKDLASGQKLHRQQTMGLEERISELKEIMVAQGQQGSPTEQFLHMLMSKPAFLKNWQDSMSEGEFESSSGSQSMGTVPDSISTSRRPRQRHTSYACGCYRRRRLTRTYSNWSVLSFFNELVVDTKHDLGCPKYSERQVTRERTVGVTYTGLHQLLNIALAASFRHVRGAGGSSISPMFRYYATVDKDNSPAFRVVRAISHGLWYLYSHKGKAISLPELEFRSNMIVKYGIRKLRGVFQQNASSPTDLDQEGVSLLGHVSHMPLTYFNTNGAIQSLRCTRNLLIELFELDVPRESNGPQVSESSVPIIRMLEDNRGSWLYMPQAYFIEELVPLFFAEDPSQSLLPPVGIYWLSPIFRDLLSTSSHMAEASDLDSPLFSALLAKDEMSLHDILQTQAESLDVPNSSGITALHVAAQWPTGLKIILNTGAAIDLNIKSNGYTPLDIAILHCKDTCVDPSRGCSNCPCADSIELLLDAGCFLSEEHIDFALEKIDSPRLAYVLLDHIRRWRARLVGVAYAYLSDDERNQLGITLDSGVLDSAAPELIRTLEGKGVSPYSFFNLLPGDYRLSPPTRPSSGCSIYCGFLQYNAAPQAFKLGFKDFDVPHSRGETTLSELARYHVDSRKIPFLFFLYYCTWLNNRGADLTRPMQWQWNTHPAEFLYPDEVPQHLIAHCLMTSIRLRVDFTRLRSRVRGKKAALFDIPYQCHTLEAPDGCRCACSEHADGCDPLTIFLTSAQRQGDPLGPIAYAFERLFRPEADDVATLFPRLAFAMIRCLTFAELGIRHTCCNTLWRARRDNNDPEWAMVFGEPAPDYGEDFPYLRDEDAPLVARLEELVAEFKEKFLSESCSIPEFLEGYWRRRMDEVMDEMQAIRLTEKERDAIAAVGVEKWEEDIPSIVLDTANPVPEEAGLDPLDVLFWTRQLDSIC